MKDTVLKILHALLIIMIVLLSGCGFRKVLKSSEYAKSSVISEIKKDSTGTIIDKSVITIKEKVDTSVQVPGKTISQDIHFNMDSLVNGLTAVKNDLIDVRLHLNPITGILSTVAEIKPFKLPVVIDKETIRHNDITQHSFQNEVKKDQVKQSSGSSIVQKDPVNFWYYIGGLMFFIIVSFSIFYWIKNKG